MNEQGNTMLCVKAYTRPLVGSGIFSQVNSLKKAEPVQLSVKPYVAAKVGRT